MAMLPTAFLPVLPRAQYTLHPLDPREIASLTSILRELYLPPVHGGLSASDAFYDDATDRIGADGRDAGDGTVQAEDDHEKQRRFSKGLAESIGTLDVSAPSRRYLGSHLTESGQKQNGTGSASGGVTPRATLSGAATPIPISRTGTRSPAPAAEQARDGENEPGSDSESGSDSDSDSEGEGDGAHLDPFEREWAQKWLQGVVRRAQTWIEQTGDGLASGETDGDGYGTKDVEGVLKDATAVLAVMAGTGGTSYLSLTDHG